MGIVTRQTSQNIIFTYIGFAIGGCSTVFLYPLLLQESYYGLIVFLLSGANIMMPIMTFGMQNTVIKFYYAQKTSKIGGFTLLVFLLPLVVIIPVGLLGTVFYKQISVFLADENSQIKPYVWLIYVLAASYAYFEIFFALEKIRMRSTFGNFMREIFHRMFIPILLVIAYYKIITPETFIYSVVSLFILRTLIMLWYVLKTNPFKLKWEYIPNKNNLYKYAILMVLMGFVANILTDIGKIAMGKQLTLYNVAHYSVATFIVTVISIPSKAMHQIVAPITAKLMVEKDINSLKSLYQKASNNLYILSGFVFTVIVCNTTQFYMLMPRNYDLGFVTMLLLSISRLLESITGNNNAIFFSSDHYKAILTLLLATSAAAIGLTFWSAPIFGIMGVVVTSLVVVILFHTAKVYLVYKYFGIHPFSIKTAKITVVLTFATLVFGFWNFPQNPLLGIGFKTILMCITFVFMVLKLSLSEELEECWHKNKTLLACLFKK